MHVADSFPHEVEVIDNIWIPMSDGVRLAAKVWRPRDAPDAPVPAILEYIPYRKRDDHALGDHQLHAYMAGHGYACIRADIRGSGDSEGLLLDEYLPREQLDAVEIIEWLAKQPWCDGNVGMMGLSWGAIASMQAATHQPAALKAIIPVGGSVDRYYDDGCYLVGCYPGETLGWGAVMFGLCARPPDPAVVGERWREMWFERLDKTPMFLETWLNHQLRDEFWLQGTVCEKYERIRVPVLTFSGWNDCWPNTVLRLLENLDGPCRGIQGPWGHIYPCFGKPGPDAGFLREAVRWWDRWLKGRDNGVDREPRFLAYLQDGHRPDAKPRDRPGRWLAEPGWPSPNVATKEAFLSAGRLGFEPVDGAGSAIIRSPQSTGLASGEYMPMFGSGEPAELPHDQRIDDAKSVCFDSEPLTDRLEILGTPRARLRLSADRPTALIAARLCDVAPDGASTLISYGVLNLSLREGRERIAPIEPGRAMDVTVRLNDTGYAVPAGHRLRLALSSAYWPMAWPSADATTLTVDLGASHVALPIREAAGGDFAGDCLGPAEAAAPPAHEVLREPRDERAITYDVETGDIVYFVEADGGLTHLTDIDLDCGSWSSQRYLVRDDDPLSAQAEFRYAFDMARGDWRVRTESKLVVTCESDVFILRGRIDAFDGGECSFSREWDVTVPRLAY